MSPKWRAIKERLRQLEDPNTGALNIDQVIAAARDPNDPMHSEFTWDVNEAANERWRDQARAMIRNVKYEETVTRVELSNVPNYVHTTTELGKDAYMPIDRVRSDQDRARQVINEELARCRAALDRARAVADVIGLRAQLEQAIEWIVNLQRAAA